MTRLLARCAATIAAASLGASPPAVAQAPSDGPITITLHEAVDFALRSHPAVQAARAMQAEAEAGGDETRAQWFPQLTAQGSLVRYEEPMIVAPLHELSQAALPEFQRTLLQGGLHLGYTLFDGGGRIARSRGAAARERLAAAGLAAAEAGLVLEVTRGYLAVLSADGVLAAVQDNLSALQSEQVRVRRLLAEGRAAPVDLLRVDAAIAQADAERISTAARLDASERSLARLLGIDTAAVRAAQLHAMQLRDTTVPGRAVLLAQQDAANPDIAQAAQAAEAADWAHRAARAAWLPHLDLQGAYLVFGSTAGEYTGEWQGGVRLSYPLFLGGARRGAIAGAAARAEVAQEQLRLAQLRGEDSLDRILTSLHELNARVAALATAVAHLTEVARIERLALAEGEGTQAEYLRAEADLRRARAALVEARNAEIVARVELARTTGELSPDWLRRMLEATR